MTRKLRVTLYAVSAYLGIFGCLFVLAPGRFAQMTQTPLPDAPLTLLYGVYTLIFALVSFLGAREKQAAGPLSLTILLVTLGNAVAFAYILLRGMEGPAQAVPPLVVNGVLTVLLFLFRRPEGGRRQGRSSRPSAGGPDEIRSAD